MVTSSSDKIEFLNYFSDKDWGMVSAPPGTGKTFLGLYACAYLESDLFKKPWNRVLILTFSRLSKTRLEEERRKLVSQGLLPRVIARRIDIHNYDSFWWSLVRRHAAFLSLPPPGIATKSEHDELICNILETARRRKKLPSTYLKKNGWINQNKRKRLEAVIENALFLCTFGQESLGNYCVAANECHELLALAQESRKTWICRGYLWYTDLVIYAHQLITHHPSIATSIRTTYSLFVIDEFQDTDAAQWAILSELRPSRMLMLCDPQQTIHAWRGAQGKQRVIDFRRYAEELGRGLVEGSLREDHRSGSINIVRQVEEFLAGSFISDSDIQTEYIACTGQSSRENWVECKKVALRQIREIKKSIVGRTISIAVLFATNKEVDDFHRFLLRCNVRARKVSAKADPLEALRSELIALVADDHNSSESVKKVFACIVALTFPTRVGSNGWSPRTKHRKGWKQEWTDLFGGLVGRTTVDLREGLSSVHATLDGMAAVQEISSAEVVWEVIHALRQISRALLAERSDDRSLRDLIDATIVRLRHVPTKQRRSMVEVMDVHQCKGHEYDYVVIPWLANRSFVGGGERYFWNDTSGENKNLLRVAMSRAKKGVFIFVPKSFKSPLCPAGINGISLK